MNEVEIAKTFLEFMVECFALTRRHIVEVNPFRLYSHGFSTLYLLRSYRDQPVTMTELAGEMGVTKQQLTKLINDLEEQGYVSRSHNENNRRQIYVSITGEGQRHLEQMIGEILHEIVHSLHGFAEPDQRVILEAATTLRDIFRKDAGQPSEEA